MSYLFFNDPDFLLKVIDCYYKKTYLKKPKDKDKTTNEFWEFVDRFKEK